MSDTPPTTGMTVAEAGRVLAVAIVLDPRLPQPDAQGFIRGVWHDALKALSFQDAYDAVIAYYSSEEYRAERHSIAPADVVAWARKLRSVGNAPAYKALPGPAPASDETRASAMSAAREFFGRHPQFNQTFAMPWSKRGRVVRTSAEDARRRAEAAAELDRVRQSQANES
ncbi:hypothetical protein [Lentzea cavernae]|uniref:Replicative helicase inhibitor G39P N-terminal domain-containing protein n=1 Tax=Lentzea cavernae TaxID=2020703 RepID=A0ABQ3MWZ6_9PSEU|nr:hypothetical protein [Lentzea cavernae]GHH57439.1 hypothetical protein GCM10017774_76930 [Lentzea cavernae]